MIYGSVCSGVEGASLAFAPLGWQCAFVADVDPFACHLMNQRFNAARPQFMPDPDAPGLTRKEANRRRANIKGVAKLPSPGGNHLSNFGDLAQHESWPIKPGAIDLLIGGTPCQDFSVAGLGAGLTGARGQLTIEFVRLLERLRPRWFVFENVPGILSNDEGRAFGMFLGLVAGVGYGFAYRVLDAQYFGLAQRRERVFVVGHLGDWRRAAAVLFDRESMLRNPPPRRSPGQKPARTLTGGAGGGSGGYRGADPEHTLIPEIGHALNTRASRQEPHAETLIAFAPEQLTNPDNRQNPKAGDPAPTLSADRQPEHGWSLQSGDVEPRRNSDRVRRGGCPDGGRDLRCCDPRRTGVIQNPLPADW